MIILNKLNINTQVFVTTTAVGFTEKPSVITKALWAKKSYFLMYHSYLKRLRLFHSYSINVDTSFAKSELSFTNDNK